MKKYQLSTIGLLIAVAIYLITIITGYDLFEKFVGLLERMEEFELDELVIPCVVAFAFTFYDQVRRNKIHKIELERVKIYRAMLGSSRHVLNNFLNQMFLFKITAENTTGFPVEVLKQYEQIVNETQTQLEKLSNITKIDEESIKESVRAKTLENEEMEHGQ